MFMDTCRKSGFAKTQTKMAHKLPEIPLLTQKLHQMIAMTSKKKIILPLSVNCSIVPATDSKSKYGQKFFALHEFWDLIKTA